MPCAIQAALPADRVDWFSAFRYSFRSFCRVMALAAAVGVSAQSMEAMPLQEAPSPPMTWGQAFDKHAPLAFFSVGSLVVGGMIVAIRADDKTPGPVQSRQSNHDMAFALGIAGMGSLVAGGAFWYQARTDILRSKAPPPSGLSIMPVWGREGGLAARWHLSFSLLGG